MTVSGQSKSRALPLKSMLLSTAVIGTVLTLDQVSKWWVLVQIAVPKQIMNVNSFFNVVLVWNRGVSFGLFNTGSSYNSYILVVISSAIIFGLMIWLWRTHAMRIRLALSPIIGGAIGNVLDRVCYDGVVDFLDFHLGTLHWPAFNIADSGITVGAVLLIADTLLCYRLCTR